MYIKIIFAEKGRFSDETLFHLWIAGDGNTALILVEDTSPVDAAVIDSLKEKKTADKVYFRLHASGTQHHEAQRKAVKDIWPNAIEVSKFSHISADPVFRLIQALANQETRTATVKSIVKGVRNAQILEALDHVAAYEVLEQLWLAYQELAKRKRERVLKLLSDDKDNHAKANDAFNTGSNGDTLAKLAEIAEAYLD